MAGYPYTTTQKTYDVIESGITTGSVTFYLKVETQPTRISVSGYVKVKGFNNVLDGVRAYLPNNITLNGVWDSSGSTTGQGVSSVVGQYNFSGSTNPAVGSEYSIRVEADNRWDATQYREQQSGSSYTQSPDLTFTDVFAEPVNCTISANSNNSYSPGSVVKFTLTPTGPVKTGVLERLNTQPGGTAGSFVSTVVQKDITQKTTVSDIVPNYPGFYIYWRYTVTGDSGQSYASTKQFTIKSNSAPNPVPSLTVPASLTSDTAFTVSWTAANPEDPDGNFAGYYLERSTDSGQSWEDVYRGPALSVSTKVPKDRDRVRFRISAYDDENAYSDYTYAPNKNSDILVDTNNAPTTPASITIPVLTSGATAVISWGSSTDPDPEDTIVYALERSWNNSSSYHEIYRGASQSYVDTIENKSRAYYRVRAIDNHGKASGYKAANRVIESNAAPTLSVKNGTEILEADSDLGTKTKVFELLYAANDTNADDILTVKTYVDGVLKRTITNPTKGINYRFAFKDDNSASYWSMLDNGTHTITFTVSDGKLSASQSFTFTKAEGSSYITLATPITADANIDEAIVSIAGEIPEGGIESVMITADGDQNSPHWVECMIASSDTGYAASGIDGRIKTSSVTGKIENAELLGGHLLYIGKINQTYAGQKFNFKIQVHKVGSIVGYISSVQGTFTTVSAVE